MRSSATAFGNDPEELRIVLRINQLANRIEEVAQNIEAFDSVGVHDIVVDVDWTVDGGPERAADLLIR